MATFSVRFLGCKVSHADAHAIREALLRDGHAEQDGAEIAVVNTCCVTHEAVRKSRHAAARAARTHGHVYVTGCAANLPDGGLAGLPENVTVVSRRSESTPEFVAGHVGAIGCVQADARLDRVRAFVRVQDGCSFSCNFCVIPLVRGRSRSRSAEAVLSEVRRRVDQGHREVVLTGINLGCFRDRQRGYTLARLVRDVGETPGLRRLRLSSIEVNHVADEPHPRAPRDADGLAAPARAAAVRRRPGAERYGPSLLGRDLPQEACAAHGLQPDDGRDRRLPKRGRARVRADAGGIREAGISKVHVFPYSPRPGTATAAADPVAPAEKKRRGARLRADSHEACKRRWLTKLGEEDEVLVDRPGRGYGDDYSPWLLDGEMEVGELVRARAAAVTGEGIVGVL